MPSLLYTLFETNRNLHYFCDLLMRRDFVFTVKHGKQTWQHFLTWVLPFLLL